MGSVEQINKIRDLILDYYNVKLEDFLSKSRKEPIAKSRQVFSYYLREKHELSFPAIAIMFYKDHTTALYAYKKVKEIIKNDDKLRDFINYILSINDGDKTGPYLGTIGKKDIVDVDKSVLTTESDDIFTKETRDYNLPIHFDSNYMASIFINIDKRNENIFKIRYGFGDNVLRTLDEIGKKERISRERVRQIVNQTLKKLFKNNYHSVGQVVYFLYEKINEYKIIPIENLLKEIFIFDKKDEGSAAKFLTALTSIGKNIRKFDFSGRTFFIDINELDSILNEINNIKVLFRKIELGIPELTNDKKAYIFEKVKEEVSLLNKKQFSDDYFIQACYDHYLFEGDIVIYDKENFEKYKISDTKLDCDKIKGVPTEYNIFFQ